MAHGDDLRVRLPLPYLLQDDDPDAASDPRVGERALMHRFKESVRRDLQDLLNTRHRAVSWPSELGEVSRSVVDYGVPDVTGANLATEKLRRAFLEELARTIKRNDARFTHVEVRPLETQDPHDRTLRFRIEARMRVETGLDSAVFDFQLEPVSRQFL